MTLSGGVARFNERRGNCVPVAVEAMDFLMTVAANAGPTVVVPATVEIKGEGFKYNAGAGQFCALHLRRDCVWVRLNGVDRSRVVAEGFEPSKQHDWFKIRTMLEAVRVVKWILHVHDSSVGTAGRGWSNKEV